MPTRRAILAAGAALPAFAAGCAATPSADAGLLDAELNAAFEASFERQLDSIPQLATALGDKRNYAAWGDPSAAFERAQANALRREARAIGQKFPDARLSAQAQLSKRLFLLNAEAAGEDLAWSDHAYRFNQMFGAQSQSPTFLINQHRVDTPADAEAYISRLRGFGDYFDGVVARSEAARAKGVLAPKHIYDYVLPAAQNIISGAPFAGDGDSPLWADAQAKISKLAIAQADKDALLRDAQEALRASVGPAYERAIATLRAQQAAAGETAGCWALPDGAAYYANRLRRMTTTRLSAAEVHTIGLENVARLQEEMRGVMKTVGFAGDLSAFFRFMETDSRFYLPQTAEGKAEYIRRATAAVDAMREKVPAFFNVTPKAAMEVRAVEAFREASAGLAFYQRPAADGSRPGVYYANTVDMKALPLYQLEALAYHEGIPGHHFQIAIAQELAGIPRFRRFGGFTAYSEGWGLYTERLAKEMGFYQDPYSDFGRMTLEIRRAIRLVVDTGLHDKRWSREQAIQYILDNQPGDRAQAEKDIDRYIVMPGQATAYLIGQREILRLREAARARLGDRFDIRGFHDVVLGDGAVPLDVLASLVEAWRPA